MFAPSNKQASNYDSFQNDKIHSPQRRRQTTTTVNVNVHTFLVFLSPLLLHNGSIHEKYCNDVVVVVVRCCEPFVVVGTITAAARRQWRRPIFNANMPMTRIIICWPAWIKILQCRSFVVCRRWHYSLWRDDEDDDWFSMPTCHRRRRRRRVSHFLHK